MKCPVVADARSGTWGNSVSAIAQNSSQEAHISDYKDYQHLIAKHLVCPIVNYPIQMFVLETLLISQNSVHALKVHISNGDSLTI